ncbi:uncharacterized protein SCHCODRAFT_02077196 [Schizophyllum commune H4-8]|uniref:uncharacterized protein n=1 Tax=Schizophyllum commune (strain H4-8 / FGSC 9210) TaxID=578458 RepID=UPI0021608020|nr:uncharacterized protein SCHCODRAFT_02077196 [Schizophyllum commune H4-8]KAI5887986.1 hypothetical protein SCHCODRAFT_02077196 [Schizophyllum commune H4-8]
MAYRRSSSISSKSSTDVPDGSEGAPFAVDAAQAPAGADDEVGAGSDDEVDAGPEADAEPHAPSADLDEGAAVDTTAGALVDIPAGDALTGGVLVPDTRLVFEPGVILNGVLHAEGTDDGGLDESGGLKRTDVEGRLGRTDGGLGHTEDEGVCGATGGNATSSSRVATAKDGDGGDVNAQAEMAGGDALAEVAGGDARDVDARFECPEGGIGRPAEGDALCPPSASVRPPDEELAYDSDEMPDEPGESSTPAGDPSSANDPASSSPSNTPSSNAPPPCIADDPSPYIEEDGRSSGARASPNSSFMRSASRSLCAASSRLSIITYSSASASSSPSASIFACCTRACLGTAFLDPDASLADPRASQADAIPSLISIFSMGHVSALTFPDGIS